MDGKRSTLRRGSEVRWWHQAKPREAEKPPSKSRLQGKKGGKKSRESRSAPRVRGAGNHAAHPSPLQDKRSGKKSAPPLALQPLPPPHTLSPNSRMKCAVIHASSTDSGTLYRLEPVIAASGGSVAAMRSAPGRAFRDFMVTRPRTNTLKACAGEGSRARDDGQGARD